MRNVSFVQAGVITTLAFLLVAIVGFLITGIARFWMLPEGAAAVTLGIAVASF